MISFGPNEVVDEICPPAHGKADEEDEHEGEQD